MKIFKKSPISLRLYLLKTLSIVLFCMALLSCQHKLNHVDLVVINAEIWTGNYQQPKAQAMAINNDTIIAIGSNEEIQRFISNRTEVFDAKNNFITPGFIDSHVHLLDGGFTLSSVQLRDAKTPQEFSERIGEYAKTLPEGTWILGSDWDGSEWGELPTKHWIDNLTPKHPVFLSRFDGHIAIANSLAMKLSGITENIPEVQGGVIGRDNSGELTGIFKDNAMTLITSKIPTPTNQQFDSALKNAMNHFSANGVTSVHNVWYPTDLKGVFDGALGSHTAAFLEPFTDDPSDKGSFMMPEDQLYDFVLNADKQNLQVAVHAIGDRAIKVLLDNYKAIAANNGLKDRRFRVEHAQHIDTNDINRFRELNIIASVQPYHAIDDGRWAQRVIGPERIKTTYAFKSLMDAEAIVAFGSDWPVAPASVLEGIYAAVTRRTIDDKNPNGWVPEQKVTVKQALVAYTLNGAFAAFEEEIKGSLEVGKLADFVVINENLLTIDPISIKDAKILNTFVGGKMVFSEPLTNN